MDRMEFEAELRREGFEVCEGGLGPNLHRQAHAHDYDVRVMVLEGAITLVFGDARCAYGPGDSCVVPAGTQHEEHTGKAGVRYLVGRRAVAPAGAAE
jgi:mannose-6-phosphate isomerase-like protein (cupin superfamily)